MLGKPLIKRLFIEFPILGFQYSFINHFLSGCSSFLSSCSGATFAAANCVWRGKHELVGRTCHNQLPLFICIIVFIHSIPSTTLTLPPLTFHCIITSNLVISYQLISQPSRDLLIMYETSGKTSPVMPEYTATSQALIIGSSISEMSLIFIKAGVLRERLMSYNLKKHWHT